jgi:hypothetical protein
VVVFTVEYHADPRLSQELAHALISDTLDAINEHGYVSDVHVLPRRSTAP